MYELLGDGVDEAESHEDGGTDECSGVRKGEPSNPTVGGGFGGGGAGDRRSNARKGWLREVESEEAGRRIVSGWGGGAKIENEEARRGTKRRGRRGVG